MYYLNSRFYNPQIGRFLNSDGLLGKTGEILSSNPYVYCENNPVQNVDENGYLSNGWKLAIGVGIILALAVATALTGGAAGVILGAALSGAVSGGLSGAVVGTVVGAITGGLQGAIDGACSGFLSGVIVGGATSAISAGLSVASGVTKVVASGPHGNFFHNFSMKVKAGKMLLSGKYSQIVTNKSLNSVGLNGSFRPDVIGIARSGNNLIVEVVSPSQTVNQIARKVGIMLEQNPGTVAKIIKWVKTIGDIFK